ncbi:hypothetical protein C8R43DRAFT_1103519 [Mycena crocata]|nr:hypothetical protein C8R43DRAFT_1103519 [Mycena crocata]
MVFTAPSQFGSGTCLVTHGGKCVPGRLEILPKPLVSGCLGDPDVLNSRPYHCPARSSSTESRHVVADDKGDDLDVPVVYRGCSSVAYLHSVINGDVQLNGSERMAKRARSSVVEGGSSEAEVNEDEPSAQRMRIGTVYAFSRNKTPKSSEKFRRKALGLSSPVRNHIQATLDCRAIEFRTITSIGTHSTVFQSQTSHPGLTFRLRTPRLTKDCTDNDTAYANFAAEFCC